MCLSDIDRFRKVTLFADAMEEARRRDSPTRHAYKQDVAALGLSTLMTDAPPGITNDGAVRAEST
jgi:hypothetical protein